MSNLNKVLSTLSIATSDTRDDSIKSIIVNTLYESQSEVPYNELIENILILYEIQLYEPELKQVLKTLIEKGEVISNNRGYKISDTEKANFEALEVKIKSEERKRYINFKTFVDDNFNQVVNQEDIKLLWEVFRKYLYNCFFHYGEKALEIFHPNEINSNDFQNSEVLKESNELLKTPALQNVFKKLIDDFPDYATQEDIDFINDLGQKALCFASLGLEPELAKDQIDFNIVDWILYLDTNFLFSILNLHVNVENDAAKELLKLIIANPDFIKVQFRYSELTLKELKSKKSDFETLASDLTKSGIQALLESDELDSFSRKYYSELFENPDETLHPNQIIDLAEVSLNAKEIKISRNRRQAEHLGEKFINAKVQEYSRFISERNEIREDFNTRNAGKAVRNYYRSESQLLHDITLRELILNSRDNFKSATTPTLNDIKYFGVTLDDLLIKFDGSELRKGNIHYPTFFKPSFLLNKLVKILPIKTENYKRAFIKAVSSRGFNKDPRKSEDVIKIVNYLKTLGIDDKKVLLNLITEKLFVEKFKQHENLNEESKKAFIESELNKILDKATSELSEAEKKIDNLTTQTETEGKTNRRLNLEKEKISDEAKNLKVAVEMLQKQVKRLEKHTNVASKQVAFDFEAEKRDKELMEAHSKLAKQEIENKKLTDSIKERNKKDFIQQSLYKWRLSSWKTLIATILILILSISIAFYLNDWKLKLLETCIKDNVLISMVYSLLLIIINVCVLSVLVSKYKNHSNINAFIARLELPAELDDSKK